MIGYVAGSGWPKMQGLITVKREHVYEGGNGAEHIKQLYDAGVRKVILTASVGSLSSAYQVGMISYVKDLITLFCPSPLSGANFVDMSKPFVFPSAWGVTHAFTKGPQYETFADKRVLTTLGADVVGMSITPEVIMAKSLGMEVIGIVCVTNLAYVEHNHKDVLAAAQDSNLEMVHKINAAVRYFNEN